MYREKLRENRYISFRYTSSWYTLWLVNGDSILQHVRQSFGFARRVCQTCRACESLLHHTFWRLTFWSKELFFTMWWLGGGGERVVCADWGIWKDAYRLSPSLFPPFFARPFFHRSLVFFALPHWPRAWHRVLYSYFERNLDSADKSSRKQCDVMMTTHHVIVSIKLCLDVGNDEYIILLHSPWHARPHLIPNYSDVTVAMNPCTLPYNVPISTSSKSYNLYGMLLLSSVQSPANTTTSL